MKMANHWKALEFTYILLQTGHESMFHLIFLMALFQFGYLFIYLLLFFYFSIYYKEKKLFCFSKSEQICIQINIFAV